MPDMMVYPTTKDYDWDGLGLSIRSEDGQEEYIQGEEGFELYDQLESLESEEQVALALSVYDTLWNPISYHKLLSIRHS